MQKKYLLVDGNSLGHLANNGSKLSLGDMPVQAIYGFLRGLRATLALYNGYTPIVTWDGASWRKVMFSDYKAIRDKADTPNEIALLEMKQLYKRQTPYIVKALKLLGVTQVRAFNMEADDIGAMLVDRFTAQGAKVVMLTGDKDWLQNVGPNCHWRDVKEQKPNKDGYIKPRVVKPENFEEYTGVKTIQQFVEVKALCGDTGDSVPGVGGVGEAGAIDFVNKYGSFDNFVNMAVFEKSIDMKKLHKKIRDLIEDEAKAITFSRNLKLVDLRTPHRPEMINLSVDKGEPSLERFRAFCELLCFKSITQELAEWLRAFPHFSELSQEMEQ